MIGDNKAAQAFANWVALRFDLYNGLFLNLPFADVAAMGGQLPLFQQLCREGLADSRTPQQLVHEFLTKHLALQSADAQYAYLRLMLNYIERQIVLFDALEDSAFDKLQDLTGPGSVTELMSLPETTLHLCKDFRIRLVLTSHPTQFYPAEVICLLTQLIAELAQDDIQAIRDRLLQLGKTSLRFPQAPTPLAEANLLIEQLDAIWFTAVLDVQSQLSGTMTDRAAIEIGFWPGGDRDGNPHVDVATTLAVAKNLRTAIIQRYLRELRRLKERLTFATVWQKLDRIITRLQRLLNQAPSGYASATAFANDLCALQTHLKTDHDGLFVEEVARLHRAVSLFGFHFASLDLRQDSRIHEKALPLLADKHASYAELADYDKLTASEKLALLIQLLSRELRMVTGSSHDPWELRDILDSLKAVERIQASNGVSSLHRYVVSNTAGAHQVLEVMLFARAAGWPRDAMSIDIIPLFESIDDLANAADIMQTLWSLPVYQHHLQYRQQQQTIMLGFSDGTKDGGYLMANWAILQAKRRLHEVADQYGIHLIFFDGRGGPPARGGGNTHRYYQATEDYVPQHALQLTLQGQTITSSYGTQVAARYNIEQLYTAALKRRLQRRKVLPADSDDLLEQLADISYQAYQRLKQHPLFLTYLEEVTPLLLYAELNIASRPIARHKNQKLQFSDLRAIPFVGAWSQMKQNVPGYYGVGTALQQLIAAGHLPALQTLYRECLFFTTLLDNAMQSLSKSLFSLTAYLAEDEQFSEFWQMLADEAALTHTTLLQVTQQAELLAHEPKVRASIELREALVLPLLVIQQFALQERRAQGAQRLTKIPRDKLQKLLKKSMAANINAARNAV